MNQEDITTDAPEKPTKTRSPRKRTRSRASAAASEGGADISAASPAPEKVSKSRAPRRRKVASNAAEATAPAEAAAEVIAPTVALPEKPHPERRRKNSKPHSDNTSASLEAESAVSIQPEQKASVTIPREESDIPEPPAEFRKPEPVAGFAMPEVVGGNEGAGNNRRKRRRNRNRNREDNNRESQQNQLLSRVDPEELNRRAWKIFLGEVTEEGLAFMDDRTALEASRRAFKVAEIFLLEASRHRPASELNNEDELSNEE